MRSQTMYYQNGYEFFDDLKHLHDPIRAARNYLLCKLPSNPAERKEELQFRRELTTAMKLFKRGE